MANICCGPSATGSGLGTDWNNMAAYASVAMVRGNTYYLADGTYAPRDLSTAEVGTTRIEIKKATIASHGVATGWLDTLGDGQVTWTSGFVVDTGYWTFDGQVGGGPGSFKTGHGFKITPSDTDYGAIVCTLGGTPALNGMIFSHISFVGPTGGGSDNGKPVAFYCNNLSNSTFSYLYFNDMGSNMFRGWGINNTVEYCWFGFFLSTALNHGEAFSIFGGTGISNWTIRYCVFTCSAGTGGIIFGDSGGAGGYNIYGCVFAAIDGNTLTGGNGLIGTWTDYQVTNLNIYNCTIIGWAVPLVGIFNGGETGEFRNNLLYNGSSYGDLSFLNRTHNHFVDAGAGSGTNVTTGTGNPFTDYPNGDFRLNSNTTAGVNLGAPYNTDMFGNARTTWTRGAIEFAGTPPPPSTSTIFTSGFFSSLRVG